MVAGGSSEEMIKPVGDYVLATPLPGQRVMEQGGIIIPDFGNARDKTWQTCRVEAVGGKCKELKVGMKVVLECYGGHLAGEWTDSVEQKKFALIREKHVNLIEP